MPQTSCERTRKKTHQSDKKGEIRHVERMVVGKEKKKKAHLACFIDNVDLFLNLRRLLPRGRASDAVGWPSFVPHCSHSEPHRLTQNSNLLFVFIHEQTTCPPHTTVVNPLHHRQRSPQHRNPHNKHPCHMHTPLLPASSPMPPKLKHQRKHLVLARVGVYRVQIRRRSHLGWQQKRRGRIGH